MKDLIVSILNNLKAQDYREGFNDSVLHQIRKEMSKVDEEKATRFWNLDCCGYKGQLIKEFMDGDESVYALYEEVQKMASGKGAFVMPEWGTRGT